MCPSTTSIFTVVSIVWAPVRRLPAHLELVTPSALLARQPENARAVGFRAPPRCRSSANSARHSASCRWLAQISVVDLKAPAVVGLAVVQAKSTVCRLGCVTVSKDSPDGVRVSWLSTAAAEGERDRGLIATEDRLVLWSSSRRSVAIVCAVPVFCRILFTDAVAVFAASALLNFSTVTALCDKPSAPWRLRTRIDISSGAGLSPIRISCSCMAVPVNRLDAGTVCLSLRSPRHRTYSYFSLGGRQSTVGTFELSRPLLQEKRRTGPGVVVVVIDLHVEPQDCPPPPSLDCCAAARSTAATAFATPDHRLPGAVFPCTHFVHLVVVHILAPPTGPQWSNG